MHQSDRNGTYAVDQSDLSMNAVSNRPGRIFVIEDDPVMQRMVEDYLEQHICGLHRGRGGES